MSYSRFVDLRIENRAHADNEAGIWPTFTDIMTVIVLVFLLSMVVVLLNSMRLQEVLKLSLTSEQAAVSENRSLTEQLETERAEVKERESELALLQVQTAALDAALVAADQERTRLSKLVETRAAELSQTREEAAREQARLSDLAERSAAELSARRAELKTLEAERTQIAELAEQRATQIATQQEEAEALLGQLSTARERLVEQRTASQQQAEQQAATIDDLQEQLVLLQAGISERERQLADLRSSAEVSDQEIAELQQRYASLDSEYQALVGLARSDAGKYAAEVYFDKIGGQYTYAMQLPHEAEAEPVDRATMERRLGELKAEHGDNLYVRIIIADNSQLSHNEAWVFTQEILEKYDYYYQE